MQRLNFHHLHYFWAVAKDGNLTRTAARLHVSQSALSTQIKLLAALYKLCQAACSPVRRGRRHTHNPSIGYRATLPVVAAPPTATPS